MKSRNMARRVVMRIAAVMLAVCMAVLVCPEALAVTYFDVWVNGVRVSSSNSTTLLSSRASYNSSSKTLTLKGATLTKGVDVFECDGKAAIYSKESINIVLEGKNVIKEITGFAVVSGGSVSISGSGSLDAATSGDMFSGIYADGSLSVSGSCSVSLSASGSECSGITADGISVSGTASVKVTAAGADACGINSFSGVDVKGGSVSASVRGDHSFGLLADGNVSVSSGSAAFTVSGEESYGICTWGSLGVAGGRLAVSAEGVGTAGMYSAVGATFSGSSFAVAAYGTESALMLKKSGYLSIDDGCTIREGGIAPGGLAAELTDCGSGMFASQSFIEVSSGSEVLRLGGGTRYDTAVMISDYGWSEAENVVLANAYSFADALAGVPLAYALDAPILLVNGKTVDACVMQQLAQLKARNVYILGGEGVISAEAVLELESAGCKVFRVAGKDRYGTAVAIAEKLAEIKGGSPQTVFFAYGFNYPDALAVSSVAALKGAPILYAPLKGQLDSTTADYLSTAKPGSAVVLGGEGAVGADVFSSIEDVVPSVERISGDTRYDTASNIISKYSTVFTGSGIAVATGTNYPDALAGAALAARKGVAVMLVPAELTAGSSQTKMLKALIRDKSAPMYVFGAQGAVPEAVIEKLLQA